MKKILIVALCLVAFLFSCYNPLVNEEETEIDAGTRNASNWHITSNKGAPYIEYIIDGQIQKLIKVNFNPGDEYPPYRRLSISGEFESDPDGWSINIGDSIGNNGYGGDDNTQMNDAELEIKDGKVTLYANDFGGSGVLETGSDFVEGAGDWFDITIDDNMVNCESDNYPDSLPDNLRVYYEGNYAYALSGQADPSRGGVNYEIYIAINRVIKYHSGRTGNTSGFMYLHLY